MKKYVELEFTRQYRLHVYLHLKSSSLVNTKVWNKLQWDVGIQLISSVYYEILDKLIAEDSDEY